MILYMHNYPEKLLIVLCTFKKKGLNKLEIKEDNMEKLKQQTFNGKWERKKQGDF